MAAQVPARDLPVLPPVLPNLPGSLRHCPTLPDYPTTQVAAGLTTHARPGKGRGEGRQPPLAPSPSPLPACARPRGASLERGKTQALDLDKFYATHNKRVKLNKLFKPNCEFGK